MPFVGRGQVPLIDRSRAVAGGIYCITDRPQEDGHYCRHVPEPLSDFESEGESGREEEVGAEVEAESVDRAEREVAVRRGDFVRFTT